MKKLLGLLLILCCFIVPLLLLFPNIYSQNSAGKIHKEIKTDFDFLKDESSEIVLLYFGFIGCRTICLPALTEINELFKKIDQSKISFYFVNLQEGVNPQIIDDFAKVFNPKFKGVYLNEKRKAQIVSLLNVKYLPSIFDKYELDHSGFLYVLKKENKSYVQKFIYTARPYDIEYISNDLNDL